MSDKSRVTISFGDATVGWCSSCDQICDTGTIDAEGRFCCGTCGDYLIFNSEELIRELQQLRQQLAAQKERADKCKRGFLEACERWGHLEAERDTLKQQLAELQSFMVKISQDLGCLPSFSDPANGNEHVFRKLAALRESRARLIGSILDRIDMAPNDDPVPYIREYVERYIEVAAKKVQP